MSIRYVADIYIDIGEEIHIKGKVKPVCGQDIPFQIRSAKWELYREKEYGECVVKEASGDCTVQEHTLDALIRPEETGRYRFKFIYQVADETWIDVVRLRVN